MLTLVPLKVSDACPVPFRSAMPTGVVLSKKVAVPPGDPDPGATALTAAVKIRL